MKVTIKLTDDQLSSLNQYLQTQQVQTLDELTGRPAFQPMYVDAEDWIIRHVGDAIAGISQQFPSVAVRAKLAQIKQLQEEIKAASKPQKVKDSTPEV